MLHSTTAMNKTDKVKLRRYTDTKADEIWVKVKNYSATPDCVESDRLWLAE